MVNRDANQRLRHRHSTEAQPYRAIHMKNHFLIIAGLLTLASGCGLKPRPMATTSSVDATPVTKAMVGRWGIQGEEGTLILRMEENRVIIAGPDNDTWRIDISDATIVGDSIHFVQKHYVHDNEPHPFNGVACNCIVHLVGDDGSQLSFGMTTIHSPDFEADILTRLE